MTSPLAGQKVAVLGAEGPLGRPLAVALAQAGAKVSVLSLSLERQADFAVHSVENELWALERAGGAWVLDGSDAAEVTAALRRAAGAAGGLDALVTHLSWEGAPDVSGAAGALAGWQHPGKAMVHVLGPLAEASEEIARAAAALLAPLEAGEPAGGTRVNAVAADAASAAVLAPALVSTAPPRPLAAPGLVVYLLSAEGAPLRGRLLVP